MNRPSRLRLLAAMALLASAMPAHAFYKCQQQGRVLYSDTPCAPYVREIAPEAAPSIADQQEAKKRAAADAKAADAAIKMRRQETALAFREQQQHLAQQAAHERNCQRLAYRVKVAKEAMATATPKSRAAAERKQQHSMEEWTMTCA